MDGKVKTKKTRSKIIRWDFEGIGYAIHQGLRKATDSTWSGLIWNLIYALDKGQWGDWVTNLMKFMREKFPKGVTAKDEQAVFQAILAFNLEQKNGFHSDHGYRALVIGFEMADEQDIRALTNFCMMACNPLLV